jgi:predicted nucleic acid-binding Zn ribbon protein
MPKFDYECRTCWTTSEITIPIDKVEDYALICGQCKNEMFKVYVATPAHFKGTGWGKD